MSECNYAEIIGGRAKNLDRSKFTYPLGEGSGQFGLDFDFSSDEWPSIDEKRMSLVIPFADGQRRDGVGDLLEVTGIDLSRHQGLFTSTFVSSQLRGSQSEFYPPVFDTFMQSLPGDTYLHRPIFQDHSTTIEGNGSGLTVSSTRCPTLSDFGRVDRLGIPVRLASEYASDASPILLVQLLHCHACPVLGMNNWNVCITNLGMIDSLTGRQRTVSPTISVILSIGPPAEVAETVVQRVPVQVSSFHPQRAGANESLQNQTMQQYVTTGPAAGQGNCQVWCLAVLHRGYYPPDNPSAGVQSPVYPPSGRFDPSAVGYTKNTTKLKNIPPTLNRSIRMPLDPLVELLRGRKIAICHKTSPAKSSRMEKGAGGLDSALRLAGLALHYCRDNSPQRVGGLR